MENQVQNRCLSIWCSYFLTWQLFSAKTKSEEPK